MMFFWYCPIRKISVERQGTRGKRFFVSEARKDELKNLTEYRGSGTPEDFPGASFWYFWRNKSTKGISGDKEGFRTSRNDGQRKVNDGKVNGNPVKNQRICNIIHVS
jgi:hypothetical protein